MKSASTVSVAGSKNSMEEHGSRFAMCEAAAWRGRVVSGCDVMPRGDYYAVLENEEVESLLLFRDCGTAT